MNKKISRTITVVVFCLLFVQILLATSLMIRYWLLDIYVSYLPQIIIVSFVSTFLLTLMLALLGKKFTWSKLHKSLSKFDKYAFATAVILMVSITIYSHRIVNPKPISGSHNVVVGTYNVLYTNDSITGAAEYFKGKHAEIIAMEEARPEFVEEARKILGYDYKEVTDCDCSAGDTEVAIVSKYPLSNPKTVIEHQNGGVLRAEATLDGGKKIAVYAVHIPPPFNNNWYKLRNDFTKTLTDMVNRDSLDVVMMGDFNTTIFSPSMTSLINDTSQKVSNITETTWPKCSWFGYGSITCVRIDQVYVSNKFEIDQRYIGDGFGSDHRPVVAELQIN